MNIKNNPLSSIGTHDKIAVISHIQPDGDSLGSLLAMGMALKTLCSNIYIYTNDIFPRKYYFLPGHQYIEEYNEDNNLFFDICFVLDCGDPQRLGYSKNILDKSKTIINIDHHISNTEFGNINILDPQASSTCEMVYNLLKDYNFQFNQEIATCLYTGIATDTGNFVYDNTTSYTHRIVAELMEYKIDLHEISYNLYQNKSLKNIKFLGYILNHMEIEFAGKVAIITVDQNLMKEFDITPNDIDGVINYARDIEGIEIAILLKESSQNEVKVGFRSKSYVDVSALARKFGGGGHKKASGATMLGELVEVRKKIEKQIAIDLGW
ncbi:DHH family phosphoesterase [Natronincola ferrireducens]|uniref:Phosphoesterase RecJ domain-containing protein n=1 Tax=Natronincola ferrireducens TaxID=393762 RepID=A0A1G9C635_9FIRM|nr:bifunctional oligoribonuclease/PAP phosphatase NrnA [Natronincola ferrireducens]SDK47142.1 phosphoesterase RecJ domain-containing protein [Natronincola ferrireducens]